MALSIENKTPVQKMATSKINWAQYIGVFTAGASLIGLDLTAEQQAGLVTTILLVQSVVTWVLRTFFTHPPA